MKSIEDIDKNIPSHLIDSYISFIKSLSLEKINQLEKNEIVIKFKVSPNSIKNNIKEIKHSSVDGFLDIDMIISNLYKCNNREEGEKYLLMFRT